jgi:hypothetical protein
MHFVFCRLYPSSPEAPTKYLAPACHLSTLSSNYHGLNNYTDTKAFGQLCLKIDLQESFSALICNPSRQKCIHLQTGDGGFRKTLKLPQKVSDGN